MAANSKVIALLSACLTLGTSAAVAALAVERDRVVAPDADCPAGACSVAVKTEVGGPPSLVYNVTTVVVPEDRRGSDGGTRLAAAERAF